MDLAGWLEERASRISERWFAEVTSRGGRWEPELTAFMGSFLALMASMLPHLIGPFRQQVGVLWQEAAELYGSVGAMRGLAAGEIIEEYQFLREALIRLVYADPPDGGPALPLREVLRLNRIVDDGVTHASIGHTDALFFALFQGSGVHQTLTPELLGELQDQLEAIRSEFLATLPLQRI